MTQDILVSLLRHHFALRNRIAELERQNSFPGLKSFFRASFGDAPDTT